MSDSLYRTAYEQALSEGKSYPSYITAADTLNIGNKNKTFLEAAGDVVDYIPNFIEASIVSGASQLYNIAPDVGNFFGGDFERANISEVMSSIDSNLGVFYENNKTSVDLVGFMLSSVVPGTAGVKILNAGQKSLRIAIDAGRFGKNTGKALGLLAPNKQATMAKALKEVANNSAPAALLSRNSLKTIGAGMAQNGYEALAFETAVAATMFKSPILENQDFGDFVSNVAWGAGVFGIIGGAVDAAKISSALKRTVDSAAVEARPWQFVHEAHPNSDVSEKLVLDYSQLEDMRKAEFPAGIDIERKNYLQQAAKYKETTIDNRLKTNLTELAGGDRDVSSTLFAGLKGGDIDSQVSSIAGLSEVTKFSVPSKVASAYEKLEAKVLANKATAKELEEYAQSGISIGYTKTWGEDSGRVFHEKPTITSLADTLAAREKITVTPKKVMAGKRKYNFSLEANLPKRPTKAQPKHWDIKKADALEVQARMAWARSGIGKLQPTAAKPLTIHVNDIPLMEKVALELSADPVAMQHVKFTGLEKGEAIGTNLTEFLATKKLKLANQMANISKLAGKQKTQEEIAAIVNVRSSLLSGEVRKTPVGTYHVDDIFAMQSHAESYTKDLVAKGLRKADEGVVPIWEVPQTIKMVYNAGGADKIPLAGINNFVTENIAIIKQQQRLYQDASNRAVGSVLKEDAALLQEINSGMVKSGAKPSGAGHGFVTAASSNYGTLAAAVENLGGITSRTIEKFKDRTRSSLEPLLYKLGQNQEAAVEWSVLNQRVRSIEGNYGLNETGDALEPLELLRWEAEAKLAQARGESIPAQPTLANPAMEARIELKSKEVRDLARAHIEINKARTNSLAELRTAQGVQFNRSPDVFYPIPIDPKEYPFFAMVTDASVTSGNQSKTLFASSSQELDDMVRKLKSGNPHLEIRTKAEAEAYFKAEGRYSYEKTLSDNYLDVAAHRSGVSAPYTVSTEPQKIVNDMLKWHMDRETGLVREAVAAKYEVQFEELRRLGDEFTNIQTSKFSPSRASAFETDVSKNPYADYIKTALAIRKSADYPWWVQPNRMADQAVSNLLKRATDVVENSKTPEELAKVNAMLEKAGYKGAAYDESMEIFANAEAAKGALSTTVQKANGIMATVVLRWDVLNAVNNAVSANVLLGTELEAVVRAIKRGDSEAAGALSQLLDVKVPGTDELIRSPQKLVAKAVMKFGKSNNDMQYFRDNGFITSISDQYRDALDSLTFTGKESVKNWDSRVNGLHTKLRDLANKGEKWTGNKLAEEFNRFVAADVMKQLTDVAVSRKLMSVQEQTAYINTFVNRTQGNYLAAQRPMMFSGPIGQAMGLFQTYQFNLLQQLLRHVGEGHSKDAMTLLGLQGTIHGMNGLPAFNAINTHLVGTASGNTEHRDTYDAVYGIAGKEGGDWLMYGAASNMLGLLDPQLKLNLYTRGDINPRHVTIVPTDPSQIPIVQATGKVLGNLITTAKKLGAGGDVGTTILQGLEHNGLSRPLAGLAQTLQGFNNPKYASYSTSNRGNVVAANDLVSLANLGRIAGGKPLDEAIALDATYRFKSYGLADAKKRGLLGRAIKTTMIAGKDPSQEQVESFAQKYVEAGGRQEEFNKWFNQLYKTANLSQANKIRDNLKSPFSQSMQRLMGNDELRDFTED